MIRCSWEKTLLLTKEENGKRVRLFASRRENSAPCQESGEQGSASLRTEKNPVYILVRNEKTYKFNADEIKCFIATLWAILMKIYKF